MRTSQSAQKSRLPKLASVLLIIIVATASGMFCVWRAPALELTARDSLMRARGVLPEPDDIVIVAIDEKSIARLGRFPWNRSLTAKVIDNLSAAQPKAIALDVLFAEPTENVVDGALADAVKRAGNVVVSEQLIDERAAPENTQSAWLRSLPEIETAAAGVGHVNVETEQDGAARELLLRLADDEGLARWALAVETVRVGNHLEPNEVSETKQFVRIGTTKIPLDESESNFRFKLQERNSQISTLRPLRMTIDYIGAADAFAAQTYSFADVLESKISAEKFRGKYVLIGATAATLGDHLAAPFVHAESQDGDQHGALMPGVEILANSINTILRNRFYRPVSDWTAAFLAALIALLVIGLVEIGQGKFEAVKQIGGLIGLLGLILLISYPVFVQALITPPLVPLLASFAVTAPLALLRRSLIASFNLDAHIGELLTIEKRLFTNQGERAAPDSSENLLDNSGKNGFLRKFVPRGLEWKTKTLGFLAQDLSNRSLLVDDALRSISEGLLIADANGTITYANRSALQILNLPPRKLIGNNLFLTIFQANGKISKIEAKELLARLMIDRETIEDEISLGKTEPSFYRIRLSAVAGRAGEAAPPPDFAEPIGLVATLSDITKHRELQQTKNDVIALVTHELRTPLTAIQGISEVLSEHEVEPESRSKMLNAINSEAKRLARMINEYLDITRLESGAQKARPIPVNIAFLVEQSLLLLEPIAAQSKIKIVRHFAEETAIILADSDLLAQAVTNLVANAIKYSLEKTEITVAITVAGEFVSIAVTDQGFGIPAESLPHIFEKFYRVPRLQDAATVRGTGLGLALAQEIVQLHGGRIIVASEPRQGSTFTIELPLTTL